MIENAAQAAFRRVSKKSIWTFLREQILPETHPRFRAAKSEKWENLKVFIRSDAHAVRAGWNVKGGGP